MEATKTYTTQDALAKVDEERAWWEGVVGAKDPAAMDAPLKEGHWSFRDVIEHLNVWQQRNIDQLIVERDRSGNPPKPWPGEIDLIEDKDERVNHKNAWFQERDRDLSADELVSISRNQLTRLSEFISDASPGDLNNPFRFKSLEGKSLAEAVMSGSLFSHLHEEHAEDIVAWVDQR